MPVYFSSVLRAQAKGFYLVQVVYICLAGPYVSPGRFVRRNLVIARMRSTFLFRSRNCVFLIIFSEPWYDTTLGRLRSFHIHHCRSTWHAGSSGYEPCRRFALPASDQPSVGIRTIRQFMRIFSCFLLNGPVSDKFRWACDRLATQIRVWQTRWRLTQLRNVSASCVAVFIECGTLLFFS